MGTPKAPKLQRVAVKDKPDDKETLLKLVRALTDRSNELALAFNTMQKQYQELAHQYTLMNKTMVMVLGRMDAQKAVDNDD